MNKNKPLVSACIITYNQEQYIAECIEGALSQHSNNFEYEIVIGEDKSTDGTLAICEMYAAKYPGRIRLLKRDINLGMAGNWVETISSCHGSYIALCEGDDYWTDPDKLSKQVSFMENNADFSMCFHSVNIAENDVVTETQFPEKLIKDVFSTQDLADRWFYPTCSILFRKSAIPFFPEWFVKMKSADMPLVHILSKWGRIKYIVGAMGVYRLHPGGISNTHTKKARLIGRKELFAALNIFFENKFATTFNEGLSREYIKYLNDWRSELSFYEIIRCEFMIFKYRAPEPLKHKIVYYSRFFLPGIYHIYVKVKRLFVKI